MPASLFISPAGKLVVEEAATDEASPLIGAAADRIGRAFSSGASQGLLHLATAELHTELPPSIAYGRSFGQLYLTRLCHVPELDVACIEPVPPPPAEELSRFILHAPPMRGAEYLNPEILAGWWMDLDRHVRSEISAFPGGAQAYLREKNPLWRMVGRVTFHLAENKRNEERPFAFLATYASRLSEQARPRHVPLANALKEYAGVKNREALVGLLTPVQRAAERSQVAKELVESAQVYHPLAWTPKEAYRFLKDIPLFEQSGIVVRVPDWWKSARPPRPVVSVKIGEGAKSRLGVDALLDFSAAVTLEGDPLSEAELNAVLASSGGLVRLKGKWVEVDGDKLAEALKHWKSVEKAGSGGISFLEGMRLLAGANLAPDAAGTAPEAAREWSGIAPGEWLDKTLAELRDPRNADSGAPPELQAVLRPYQEIGVNWLRFMTGLGLGACLADDMGLGKTLQVLALLLHLRRGGTAPPAPSLLVVPASLIANWKAEIARFAPSLSVFIAHSSEQDLAPGKADTSSVLARESELVITTFGMLSRLPWLRETRWNLVVLDEAQAIKNSGTRQAKAVKELQAAGRIALTGTPVENRLSDLWSLFDFINPGLLGGAKAFATFAKRLGTGEQADYGPLRALVKPYILRRLKTDRRIISDLPEKTEINAFCGLGKEQVALYEQSVRELEETLKTADGIQRRGIVLAYLMRLKQICNHPSQWLGDNAYDPAHSGKFRRLGELCEELAERQERVLVFTQFREITEPVSQFLATVFGRPGLVLHGGTAVAKRRELVEAFQRDDGPPFFILSLKAGGTGLNLTAASQVIHFDRWWNPAVENQATDRAFRIGQKRNVLVHKFVCRGTVEERIDQMIAQKVGLSRQLLDTGAEKLLTEMSDKELLHFVSIDVRKATES